MSTHANSSENRQKNFEKSEKTRLNKVAFENAKDDSEEEPQPREKELVSYLDDPNELRDSNSLPDTIRRKWGRLAFWLSLFSAFTTLAFSVASFLVSRETSSSSIFANAFDALLGTVSSVAVAWRFRDELNGGTISVKRERIATFGIGLSFIVTGIVTVAAGIVHLTETDHPRKTNVMLIILWCSFAVFLLLGYAQRCLANKLNSQSMWAASADSVIAGVMSFGIGISTIIYRNFPAETWWLDHIVAIALGMLSTGYGIHLLTLVVLCNREIFGDAFMDYDKVPLQ